MKLHRFTSITLFLSLTCSFFSCNNQTPPAGEPTSSNDSTSTIMNQLNILHSYANIDEVHTSHLDLNMNVDFEQKVIKGQATHTIVNSYNSKRFIVDVKDLTISKVTLGLKRTPATFRISESHPVFGSALEIDITAETKLVHIHYLTSSKSEAVQWLSPQQTANKTHPFLFTQGEAILTRTWIPCQDTPKNKISYSARVEVPKDLLAVMSAENLNKKNDLGLYNFKLNQPIPTYLIALAIGNLEFDQIDNRTGVYAEPALLKASVDEFKDTGKMLDAAEGLFGKYMWGRYDIIVLPPSFPFGGMENPRLTFATPTIIAGDRSLTALIAHEMAHSWSGNLVTNATWDDFWLNEGFTVYFERRIMESLYGKEYSNMLALLGKQDLDAELVNLTNAGQADDTKLKLSLKDRNPDDGMTDIAYEKGAALLTLIEQTVGRDKFDPFLTKYFEVYRFQSITTEDFIQHVEDNLLKPNNVVLNLDEWINQPGLPDNCPIVESDKFINVEKLLKECLDGKSIETSQWSTHEWLHFLRNFPATLTESQMIDLDKQFNFTNSGNAEIAAAWYEHVITNEYKQGYDALEQFLIRVGRRKFLTPLYKKMKEGKNTQTMALSIYGKARPNYHAVSTLTLDELLDYKEE